MTRGLFATMLERADTKEAIGLNRSRLRSTRPVHCAIGVGHIAGKIEKLGAILNLATMRVC